MIYNDVGKEIKEIANHYVWGKAIRYSLVGLAVSIAAIMMIGSASVAEIFLALIATVICGAIGYSSGRREALMFYAWGEVVDRVISLERKLSGSCDRQAKKPKKVIVNPDKNNDYEGMPKAVRMEDGTWQCLWCDDFINPANVKTCKNCGRVHEFE